MNSFLRSIVGLCLIRLILDAALPDGENASLAVTLETAEPEAARE